MKLFTKFNLMVLALAIPSSIYASNFVADGKSDDESLPMGESVVLENPRQIPCVVSLDASECYFRRGSKFLLEKERVEVEEALSILMRSKALMPFENIIDPAKAATITDGQEFHEIFERTLFSTSYLSLNYRLSGGLEHNFHIHKETGVVIRYGEKRGLRQVKVSFYESGIQEKLRVLAQNNSRLREHQLNLRITQLLGNPEEALDKEVCKLAYYDAEDGEGFLWKVMPGKPRDLNPRFKQRAREHIMTVAHNTLEEDRGPDFASHADFPSLVGNAQATAVESSVATDVTSSSESDTATASAFRTQGAVSARRMRATAAEFILSNNDMRTSLQ